MACACTKRKKQRFLWTPPEGSDLSAVEYGTEIEAKAKVLRKGGSYVLVSAGG